MPARHSYKGFRREDYRTLCLTRAYEANPPDSNRDDSFPAWLRETTPTWTWDWDYQILIQEQLLRVRNGEIDRLMLFVPPRHGKSQMTTVRFPMWWLEQDPSQRIMVGAYNATLACKFSRNMRKIAKGRIALSKERTAVDDWETTQGGGVRAVGVGGGVTGHGANLILIDDPVKSREEANSAVYRERCYDWYTDDLFTRREPGCPIILIMTRWHTDDLAGRILASEDGPNWTVIRLPALAEANDPLGRLSGQALCPARYNEKELATIARVLRDGFQALYQQRPTSDEGAIFKGAWFHERYVGLPKFKGVATLWDTAMKAEQQNDETAALTVGIGENGYLYALRLAHGRWETPALADFLAVNADFYHKMFGPLYRGDFIESTSSGQTLIKLLRKTRPDLALIPIVAERDKVSRAHGVTPLAQGGSVVFPDTSVHITSRQWVEDLLAQLLAFPLTKHDDMVDVFVYALMWLMGTLKIRKSVRKGGVSLQ